VTTGGQSGLDAQLESNDPGGVESRRRRLDPLLFAEFPERRPSPEDQGLVEQSDGGLDLTESQLGSRPVDQLLEAGDIELLTVDLERISDRAGDRRPT
jgi:hypothetical protein